MRLQLDESSWPTICILIAVLVRVLELLVAACPRHFVQRCLGNAQGIEHCPSYSNAHSTCACSLFVSDKMASSAEKTGADPPAAPKPSRKAKAQTPAETNKRGNHFPDSDECWLINYVRMATKKNVWYYRDRCGVARGPAPLPTLKEAWVHGLIDEHTMVWGQGLADFLPIKNVRTLVPQIRTPEGSRPALHCSPASADMSCFERFTAVRTELVAALLLPS
jgi:GYF domain 2